MSRESVYLMQCDVCDFSEIVPSYISSFDKKEQERWKHIREWNTFEMDKKKIDVCSRKCLLAHVQGFEKGFKEGNKQDA